jgi:hypothetical protein
MRPFPRDGRQVSTRRAHRLRGHGARPEVVDRRGERGTNAPAGRRRAPRIHLAAPSLSCPANHRGRRVSPLARRGGSGRSSSWAGWGSPSSSRSSARRRVPRVRARPCSGPSRTGATPDSRGGCPSRRRRRGWRESDLGTRRSSPRSRRRWRKRSASTPPMSGPTSTRTSGSSGSATGRGRSGGRARSSPPLRDPAPPSLSSPACGSNMAVARRARRSRSAPSRRSPTSSSRASAGRGPSARSATSRAPPPNSSAPSPTIRLVRKRVSRWASSSPTGTATRTPSPTRRRSSRTSPIEGWARRATSVPLSLPRKRGSLRCARGRRSASPGVGGRTVVRRKASAAVRTTSTAPHRFQRRAGRGGLGARRDRRGRPEAGSYGPGGRPGSGGLRLPKPTPTTSRQPTR